MTLISYQQMIIQGMYHLNELTHLDIIWHDPQLNKVHALISRTIPSGLDLVPEQDFARIRSLCLAEAEACYCVAASRGCLEFILIPLQHEAADQGMLQIGPFLTTPVSEIILSELMLKLKLPLRQHQALRHFYDSLPPVPTHYFQNIGHIAMHLFGYMQPLCREVLYQSEDFKASVAVSEPAVATDMEMLEQRYEHENLLLYAIANHDAKALKQATSFFEGRPKIKDRYPDNPLRSAKNLAIVLNTILRHGAADGGLHPVYLDRISTKYAILIEQAATRTAVNQLHAAMYRDYFDAVQTFAHPDVSPFIRKVIDVIQLNLDSPLTVTILAERFKMQPSNLANLFKRETGTTLSEYVNRLRIKEACHYLTTSRLSISEISHLIGFQDANYFSRLFKTHTGQTPSQYKNQAGHI